MCKTEDTSVQALTGEAPLAAESMDLLHRAQDIHPIHLTLLHPYSVSLS